MWIQIFCKLLRPFCIGGLIVGLSLIAACNLTSTPLVKSGSPNTPPLIAAAPTITLSPPTAPWTITPVPTALPSHGGPIRDHVSFVDTLRARGYTVDIVDSVEQPFLRGVGTLLRVSGGNLSKSAELQSFDYIQDELKSDPLQAAGEDAQQIEPNGQPRTMRIDWLAPPHFYRRERVIVLYLGSDAQMLALLQELLGPRLQENKYPRVLCRVQSLQLSPSTTSRYASWHG